MRIERVLPAVADLQSGTLNAARALPPAVSGDLAMSAPKPHIKPKADPHRQQTEPRTRDARPHREYEPPVFAARDTATEQNTGERVLFHEDDCLR